MENNKKIVKGLSVRIPKDLYQKMRHISVEKGKSLNRFVIESFEEIVKKHEKEVKGNE